MTRDEVLAKLRAHEAELRAAGVERLWLFGSVARDEARDESDVDLMFERDTARPFTFVDLDRLNDRLEALLGRKVDVGTREGMWPWVRDRILRTTVPVF